MEVPVVLCFDKNHAAYAAVATYSRKNTKLPLLVYWVVPAGHLESVAPYCKRFAQTGLDISVIAADDTRFGTWKECYHITRATYLRLLVPDLLSHQKALYLDTDTLTVSDIRYLLNTDIGNNSFAGVPDPLGAQSSRMPRPMGDPYINAGVLLMNLEMLRRDNFVEKIQNIYARYEQEVTWPDQCLINKYAENKKVTIGEKSNRQIFPNKIKGKDWDLLVAKSDTKIFHFHGPIKPWMEWCNPRVRSTWWAYANALDLTELKIMKADTVNTGLELASVLDLNEQYKEASTLKSNLILALMNEIRRLARHPK